MLVRGNAGAMLVRGNAGPRGPSAAVFSSDLAHDPHRPRFREPPSTWRWNCRPAWYTRT